MERRIKERVQGFRTQDGAGVSLVRVLSNRTVESYDPILMLDSFDSTNPNDYIKGFPLHPHRGIETISYVYKGQMTHKDSLGNEDTIVSGEVQWMTAGSGIMHEEMLPASPRMLGVQLWLNLPAKDKMCPPAYHAIKNKDIKEIDFDGGKIRILTGKYLNHEGYMSKYLALDYYDVHLEANRDITIDTNIDKAIMCFTLLGDAIIGGELVKEKTAVRLTEGSKVTIGATNEACQVLFISSNSLGEPYAWGGPIVMNTREELQKAFDDLRNGTFLRDKIVYE